MRSNARDPFAVLGRRIDLKSPIPKPIYAVEGLPWRLGRVGALVSSLDDGLPLLVARLAVALANGAPWLGHRTRKGRVLCLCFEPPLAITRLIQREASAAGLSLNDIDARETAPGDLATPALRNAIKCGPWDYVLLDASGEDPTACVASLNALRDAIVWPGQCAIAALDALKPAERPSHRSVADWDGIDSAVGVWQPPDADEYTFEITCLRAPEKRFKDERFQFPAPQARR